MAGIGIIGAGTAGLHLGLKLLAHGVPVTLYTDREPALLRSGRLPNTVAHHAATRARERELGVNHWDAPEVGMFQLAIHVGGEQPFGFHGRVEQPSIFVDYRLYQPRLAEDFVARGGQLELTSLANEAALARLARPHELVVMATGRAGLSSLFPRLPEHSPHTRPPRLLFAGLFRGIRFPEPNGMTYNIIPGHGEIFESQVLSAQGRVANLLIEAIPGGVLEPLATRRYEDDPRGFEALLLELLREHAPTTYARVDPDAFGLRGPLDFLQGAFTPTVRRGYAALAGGRFAVAVGDAHVLNDPIAGQGANAASGAAWALADAILEALAAGHPFDEDFCRHAEERTWAAARATTLWTNALLQPPPPHLLGLLLAASREQAVADRLVNTFLQPEQALEAFGTSEGAAAFLARR